MHQTITKPDTPHPLNAYYRFHAGIYDATRWTFLFGRKSIIDLLPFEKNQDIKALEVGCGSGFNSKLLLQKLPNLHLEAVDLSEDMIKKARQRCSRYSDRINWHTSAYERDMFKNQTFDLVLYSYSASMINPGWDNLFAASCEHLKPNGVFAVVDFHSTPFTLFSKWMKFNHVEMQGQLLPRLQSETDEMFEVIKPAYGNLWKYFLYIGLKNQGL